ncbi:hypothetical protein [Halocalculus aciditolerans]|uniref:DUF8113 domain-containing protein n=1 Tax=Halocalculus aciditolerans TaxID=1383812 RepID=A0A830FL97_9EURY|nr:hypothetical protein [Halocalculus aciditolerans]GGL63755.1 hypothetical protein GCM10009039_22060 [Halocalculus aciditolerans]
MSDDTDFDDVLTQATDALDADDLESVYLGLIHEGPGYEFYFGNETDDLRTAAVTQLGMLCRVLADQSDLTVEELAELAVDRANELGVR